MKPLFFASPDEMRAWLAENHAEAKELWVGFHKRDTGKPSVTWPQSVDQALCFGWIDGVRKRIDEARYQIRFSPRRERSFWSAINTRRVKVLEAEGLMTPAGRAAFEARDAKRTRTYSYERKRGETLAPALQKRFKAEKKAWGFWQAQPPWYRRVTSFWVSSAKREETREKRFTKLVAESARGRTLLPVKRKGDG
jgi:uncharacterized protein YdeI (YjbR/CyaY-like superfamily)